MTLKKYLPIALVIVALIQSCKPELKELKFENNALDISKYVAVGSSYAAGYQNNALYASAQEQSFPSIIARQFQVVGGHDFRQPLFNSNTGVGYNSFLQTYVSKYNLVYKPNCLGITELKREDGPTPDVSGLATYIGSLGPYNNMGVPGMKSVDLNNTDFGETNILLSKNPFYSRFATSPGNSTVLTDATRQLPTFFSFWVGFNDVMDCAMAGYNLNLATITPQNLFESAISNALTSLTAGSKKGVVANIPAITDMPYFTTIPYNALLLTQQEADTLNILYASNNPPITFTAGNNPLVIVDTNTVSRKRQIKEGELVLLSVPIDSIRCGGWGSNTQKPLLNRYVLTQQELVIIQNAIAAYNSYLKNISLQNNLAFVDIHAFFKSLKSGIVFNGVKFTNTYLSGQFFSTDGITTTGKGSALIANEFIKSINEKYGSRIPAADVNLYQGMVFP